MDFEYKGKTFSTKRLPWSEIEQYEIGDQIPMKTYRDSEEFIPIGYSAKGELFAFTVAVFVGIICMYKGLKKKQSRFTRPSTLRLTECLQNGCCRTTFQLRNIKEHWEENEVAEQSMQPLRKHRSR